MNTPGPRWLLIGMLVLAVALALPRSASAHANLVLSLPASGGRVDALPTRLRMEFTEGVVSLDVQVTDQTGEHYETGRGVPYPADQRIQTVALRSGGNGIYTVTWLALSVDGHTTDGSYFFLVGDAVPDRANILAQATAAAARQGGGPNPAEVLARSLLFLAMTTIVGLPLAMLALARQVLSDDRLWSRIRRTMAAAGLLLAMSSVLLAAAQFVAGLHHFTLERLPLFLAGPQGSTGSVRIVAGLAIAAIALRAEARPGALVRMLAAGLGVQITVSLASHSQTLLAGAGPVFVDLGHLLAAAMWGGGLVLLAVILPGVWTDRAAERGRATIASVGRRFSRLAIAGVGLVVTTGLLLAAYHLGGWDSVTGTSYGNAALAKVGLLLFAIALGAWHRLRLVDAIAGGEARALRSFTTSVRVEAAAVALILLLSAFMTSTETGTGAATAGRSTPARLTRETHGVEMLLTVTPMTAGFNVFDVEYRRGVTPATGVDAPTLLLRLPSAGIELDPVLLKPTSDGLYSSVAALTQPGAWEVRVSGDLEGAFLAGTFALPEARSGASAYRAEPGFAQMSRAAAAVVAMIAGIGLVIETAALRRRRVQPKRSKRTR